MVSCFLQMSFELPPEKDAELFLQSVVERSRQIELLVYRKLQIAKFSLFVLKYLSPHQNNGLETGIGLEEKLKTQRMLTIIQAISNSGGLLMFIAGAVLLKEKLILLAAIVPVSLILHQREVYLRIAPLLKQIEQRKSSKKHK